jgi:hypothetical protein
MSLEQNFLTLIPALLLPFRANGVAVLLQSVKDTVSNHTAYHTLFVAMLRRGTASYSLRLQIVTILGN